MYNITEINTEMHLIEINKIRYGFYNEEIELDCINCFPSYCEACEKFDKFFLGRINFKE